LKFLVFLVSSFLAVQPVRAGVLLGIDVLEKDGFEILKGKRVGLITNTQALIPKAAPPSMFLNQLRM